MPEYLKLTILNPESISIEDISVREVIVPASNGMLGIKPGHAPLMAMLKKGNIFYADADGKEQKVGIHKGFAEILGNKVLILATGEKFAEILSAETYKQEERQSKNAGIVQGDEMDLDEAAAMINRSIAVMNNLSKNAKKKPK